MLPPANDAPPRVLLTLEATPEDDRGFLHVAGPLLNGALALCLPQALWLVRVEGWFDAKWLRFEGKLLGVAGVRGLEGDEPVVPPFKPSRLMANERFLRW